MPPLVSQAKEIFGAARADDNGLIIRPENAPLALRVSKGSLRRALLITDALLKAFEDRGYRVFTGPKVELDGVRLCISLEEQLESQQEQSKEHDLSGHYSFGHSRFNRPWVPSRLLERSLASGNANVWSLTRPVNSPNRQL